MTAHPEGPDSTTNVRVDNIGTKKNPDQQKTVRITDRGKKRRPKTANGRTSQAQTETINHRYKGPRYWLEFEIIIGKGKKPLNIHRIQIGKHPGEDDTAFFIKIMGENKLKNLAMEVLKRERKLTPLEVPTFSPQVFS